MTAPIVIYHDKCLDGTCAAWVASQYLPKDTEFIPVSYGKPFPQQIGIKAGDAAPSEWKEKTLYILDWCPDMHDLDQCCDVFNKVILIDHHESAIKKLHDWKIAKGYQTGIPDNLMLFLAHNNEWSGAMGTAIWFAEQERNALKQRMSYDRLANFQSLKDHWLVKAVDDRDRWQFKLPDTEKINEGLFLLGTNLEDWLKYDFSNLGQANLYIAGNILIQKKKKDAQSIVNSCAMLKSAGHEGVVFVNCPYFYASDVGNILAKEYRLAICWYLDKDMKMKFSIRSNKKTEKWINCAEVAAKFGGGGHANAGGFTLDVSGGNLQSITAIFDSILDRIFDPN